VLAAQLPRGAQVYEAHGSDYALTREAAYLHGMEFQLRAANWQRGGGKDRDKPHPLPSPSEEREQAAAEAARAARKAAMTSDDMLRAQLEKLRAQQSAAEQPNPEE